MHPRSSRLFQTVFLLLTFVLSASSSPVLNQQANLQCSARNIAIVRRTVLDETYFCKWWLSDIRTRSPFLEFTPDQVTKLCKCIATTSAKTKRDELSASQDIIDKRQAKISCSTEVKVQFTEPWHFCNFYNAYPRTSSPFAKYSAKQLLGLCNCVIGRTTTSTKKSSSSLAKITSSSRISTALKSSSTKKSSTRNPSIKSSTIKNSSAKSSTIKSSLSTKLSSSTGKTTSSRETAKSSMKVSSHSSSKESFSSRTSRTAPIPVPSIVKSSTESSKASTTAALSSIRTFTSSTVFGSSSKTSSRFPSTSSKSVSSSASLTPNKASSQAVSSKTTTSSEVSTTSTGSYCSAGLDLKSGVQIAQASAYCSLLLRPVFTAVSTKTEVFSTALPTVRSTSIVVSNLSVAETIALTRVETERSLVPVTAQFTAIYTRNVSDYVETTNIGTVSIATITEFTTSTVTPSVQSTALANRDVDIPPTLEPEAWAGLPPAQIMQICDCIIGDVSMTPSTIYKSTGTQTRTATEWMDIDATSTQISVVTSFITQTHISTLRLNFTSTIATATSNHTITNRWNATYTTSLDSSTTTTQQVTELTTYSSLHVPSPTASDVPAVALSQPTAIVGDLNGAPYNLDDQAYSVSLPVNVTLYGQSSADVMVSSNALFGLTGVDYEYSNTALPYHSSGFGDIVAFGLWDDLYIYQGTQQGIYYEVSGSAPRRQTAFEFYVSHYQNPTAYYHFLMKFAEDKPNIVTYQYLSVSDLGQSATVGVQDTALGQYVQFSYNQPIICPGMQLTFDTTPGSNSYHIDTPGNCTVSG